MGTKTVPARPSELIILAINNLEDRDGSSPHDIVKFITNELKMNTQEIAPRVQEALKRAMQYGIITVKDGKYKLQDIPKFQEEGPGEATDQPAAEGMTAEGGDKITSLQKPKRRIVAKKVRKRKKAPVKSQLKNTIKAAKEVKLKRSAIKKICRRCQSKAVYFPND